MSGNVLYTAPPVAFVSATDKGGKLLIVDVVTLTLSLFSVGLRVYISNPGASSSRNGLAFYKDDVLFFLAAAFCITQFALVWVSVGNGNGKTMDLISPENLVHIQKIQYAVDIIYVAILFFSRASVILLLERLQGLGPKPLWTSSLAILSTWFFACVLAVALKCDLHQPWIQYDAKCTGRLARWQAIEGLGIVSECAIFGLALYLVYVGRMTTASRVKIVMLFGTRILVVLFSAIRLSVLPSYFHSTDPTFTGVQAAVFAMVETSISVTTATTPLLKSFILKFKILHGTTPPPTRPLFTLTMTARRSIDGGRESYSTEQKLTSSSSSDGDGSLQKEDSHPV